MHHVDTTVRFYRLLTLTTSTACAQTELVVNLALDDDKPGIHLVKNGVTLESYPIAAPRHTPSCVRERDVFGVVTKIDHRATWRPTQKTRDAKARKGVRLKEAYGPDEGSNALAGRAIHVAWTNACFDDTVRIHGTHDTHFVVQRARVSRGCFRMIPADWDALASSVTVGTRVRVTRSFVP